MHFGVRGDMICNETRYFKLNRILLLVFGLWPYQQRTKARLQIIVIFGILASSILLQLRSFVTDEVTLNFVIKVLSTVLCNIIAGIQYISFWINMKTVRWSFEFLQDMCNNLKDKNEIAIIESYGRQMKRYTIFFTLLVVLTMMGALYLAVEPMLGPHIDVDLLMNKSQQDRILQMILDYLVNQKKDLCLILLHANVSLCMSLAVTIAIGTMFTGYFEYACGMFSIASYRIKNTINIKQENQNDIEIIIHKGIIRAVDIHRKAIKYCRFLITGFEKTFFVMVSLGVICLSFNLYQVSLIIFLNTAWYNVLQFFRTICNKVFQIMLFEHDVMEFLRHLGYSAAIISYMFYSNYFGQEITDHYNLVFITAYNIQWYMMPLSVQRLIILLLQRGNRNFILRVGKILSPSLETFATLTSASMSYFTVIYSMQ